MKQLNLFDTNDSSLTPRKESITMDKDALIKWKQRIFKYQDQVRNSKPPLQQTLFDLPKTSWHTVDDINPFSLKIHSCLFWRMPEPKQFEDDTANGCLYFIIDNNLPILLYVGQTKLSVHQRWAGVHDCKDYIANYIELHRIHKVDVAVVSAFWTDIPADKKLLLEWEKDLIFRYRSPFNKEMWNVWGKPFGKIIS